MEVPCFLLLLKESQTDFDWKGKEESHIYNQNANRPISLINTYIKTMKSLIINKIQKKIEVNLSDDQQINTDLRKVDQPSQQCWLD